MTDAVVFETRIVAIGNNTGIEVPPEVIERLGAGKRPPVVVDVNGYAYRSTVGVMGGKHMISVSAAIRKETGLAGGDTVRVALQLAETPRPVDIHPDFAAALSAHDTASAFFSTLPNSLQRYHADSINAAKTEATRQRRIEKTVALLAARKRR